MNEMKADDPIPFSPSTNLAPPSESQITQLKNKRELMEILSDPPKLLNALKFRPLESKEEVIPRV